MKTVKTLKSYAGLLFKDSLVTGITPIIQSETSIKKCVQISILVIGITGFLYQTGQFILLYWEYATVQSEGSLSFIRRPAVTFCDSNIYRRSAYCTKFPEKCRFYKESEKGLFCSLSSAFCIDPNDTHFAVYINAFYNGLPEGIYEVNFTKEFGSQLDSLVSCDWYRSDNTPSNKSLKFLSTCSYGKSFRSLTADKIPRSCFTVDSTLGDPNGFNKGYQNDLLLTMTLKWLSQDYAMNERPAYYISIHDSKQIVNPFQINNVYTQGLRYKIHVYQRDTARLPTPYATQCHDYVKDWVKNGGFGPLNIKECQDTCEIKFQSHYYGCVSKEITYPHEKNICHIEPSPDVKTKITKCRSQCKPACKETEYSISGGILDNVPYEEATKAFGTPFAVKMEFHIHVDGSAVIKHEPKYERIELFSYIGSYIGMWLGWSILALLDFLGTVAKMFQYPFIKRKQRKANHIRQFNRRHYEIH